MKFICKLHVDIHVHAHVHAHVHVSILGALRPRQTWASSVEQQAARVILGMSHRMLHMHFSWNGHTVAQWRSAASVNDARSNFECLAEHSARHDAWARPLLFPYQLFKTEMKENAMWNLDKFYIIVIFEKFSIDWDQTWCCYEKIGEVSKKVLHDIKLMKVSLILML